MERSKNKRPAYVSWYKTNNWKKLRLKVLSRHPLCVFCKKKGIITESVVADHIVPHRGDMELFFKIENLTGLCKHCHSSTKQKYEKSGEFGCDTDGIVPGWR